MFKFNRQTHFLSLFIFWFWFSRCDISCFPWPTISQKTEAHERTGRVLVSESARWKSENGCCVFRPVSLLTVTVSVIIDSQSQRHREMMRSLRFQASDPGTALRWKNNASAINNIQQQQQQQQRSVLSFTKRPAFPQPLCSLTTAHPSPQHYTSTIGSSSPPHPSHWNLTYRHLTLLQAFACVVQLQTQISYLLKLRSRFILQLNPCVCVCVCYYFLVLCR